MKHFWLGAIILLGLGLRLVNLANLPPGFNPDEAAFGYNAYSLLLTGRDEWNGPWFRLPFTNLRSFGDYKLPLYSFLAVPSIKFFGLTEMATRLPNALFGSLAVPALFVLVRRLKFSRSTSLLSAFFLAVSPWHIALSRGAFEANLATLFFPLAAAAYLSGAYWSAAFSFILAFYSYHSARLLTFPYLLSLGLFRPGLSLKKLPAFLVFLVLVLPGLISLLGSGSVRTADVSILHPTDSWAGVASERFQARNAGLPDPLARLISNKVAAVFTQFSGSYLTFFSPQFFFSQGAGEGTYGLMPGVGLLYWAWLPLYLGFWIFYFRRPRKNIHLLLLLLFLSPLPAALAKSPGFAANRTAAMLPWLIIVLALGTRWWLEILGRFSRLFLSGLIIVSLASLVFFYLQSVYLAPFRIAPAMHYGWREAVARFVPMADQFAEIRVGRSLSEPHIFIAFYTRYPPREYQAAAASWSDFSSRGYRFLDMYDGYRLGRYRFGDIYPTDPVTTPVLFIGEPKSCPPGFPEYFHIDYPAGSPAIIVASARP